MTDSKRIPANANSQVEIANDLDWYAEKPDSIHISAPITCISRICFGILGQIGRADELCSVVQQPSLMPYVT